MQFKITRFFALVFPIFLVGCGGGGINGGSNGGTGYDGVWRVTYVDPNVVDPTPPTGQTVRCGQPDVPITLVNGVGATTQDRTCDFYIVDATTGAMTATGNPPVIRYYNISVAITSANSSTTNVSDVLTGEVNGVVLTGKCISTQGCSAQGLSLIR